MKKGVLYIQLPFVDSPSIKDAIDNAPSLDGVDLNAPLFASISTTSASISRDNTETFATSPSLIRAALRYILHYEFDVPEFLELLDSLEEVRITASRKEEIVDVFSTVRTLREFDITSLSTGSPPEELGVFDASDVSTQIGSGSINELLFTVLPAPIVAKVPNKPLLDLVGASVDLRPQMFRPRDFGDDFAYIPAIDLAEGRGEFFSIQQTSAQEDEFSSKALKAFVSLVPRDILRDKVSTEIEATLGYGPLSEDTLLFPQTDVPNNRGMIVEPRVLPNYRELVNTASRHHFVGKILPGGLAYDIFYMLPDKVRKKFGLDVGFRGFRYTEEGPLQGTLKPPVEYRAETLERYSILFNRASSDSFFAKSSKVTPTKTTDIIKEQVKAISEKFGFNIGHFPFPPTQVATESFARKKLPKNAEELLLSRDFVNFKGKVHTLTPEKFKVESERRTNKIIIDFLIERTFWSIHSDLAGFIVSVAAGDYVWVDLGVEYANPIYHSSVDLDNEGNPIDDEGNPYTPANLGWPAGTPFYLQNERYIQTTARSNMGRFRQGRESALYSEYRDRYGAGVAGNLGKQRYLGYAVWEQHEDSIERFGEYGVVSTDSKRIRGEGGEALGLYFAGSGYGFLNQYGPAPLKWTYDYHGQTGSNAQKYWGRRGGIYYGSYIHKITHQASGRRINLLLREMTAKDVAQSNRYGEKRQYSHGTTFIDKILQESYWGPIFKLVQGLVQIQAGSVTEDSSFIKEVLNSTAIGPRLPVITDGAKTNFLHRYESDLLVDPIYDVELLNTPGLEEKVWPDGNRYWVYNSPQPTNWEAKVRLKPRLDFDDFYNAKSAKPLVLTDFLIHSDKFFGSDVKDPNKFIKRVAYTITRTPIIGYDLVDPTIPIYGAPVTTFDDESVHIVPATYNTITSQDGEGNEIVIGYKFVKGEAFQLKQGLDVTDTASAKMLQAILIKTPNFGTLNDGFYARTNEPTQKISPLVQDSVAVKEPQGYYITTEVFNPETEQIEEVQVFIPKPEISQKKDNLLNEVAAADSGTAFVPVYCLPSYFMETYVGEDGKHASF